MPTESLDPLAGSTRAPAASKHLMLKVGAVNEVRSVGELLAISMPTTPDSPDTGLMAMAKAHKKAFKFKGLGDVLMLNRYKPVLT